MKEKKIINILGHKVPEDQLKASLKDVLKKRGMEGILVLDKKMTKKEELLSVAEDDYKYTNVYKYSFF